MPEEGALKGTTTRGAAPIAILLTPTSSRSVFRWLILNNCCFIQEVLGSLRRDECSALPKAHTASESGFPWVLHGGP